MSGMLLSLILSCNPQVKKGDPSFRPVRESDGKIREALAAGPKTRKEIAESTGLSISTVWKRIKSLESDGEVTSIGKVKIKCTVSLIWKLKGKNNAG